MGLRPIPRILGLRPRPHNIFDVVFIGLSRLAAGEACQPSHGSRALPWSLKPEEGAGIGLPDQSRWGRRLDSLLPPPRLPWIIAGKASNDMSLTKGQTHTWAVWFFWKNHSACVSMAKGHRGRIHWPKANVYLDRYLPKANIYIASLKGLR